MQIRVAADAAAVADDVARWLATRIIAAVQRRGRCRIAFSGGSTPLPMFDALAMIDLPWARVDVFQVDERVAPDGHGDRNATALLERLIEPIGAPRPNVHLMPVTATDLTAAARDYAAALGASPLDIVHLGLGDDGHTASWAPGDAVIDDPAPVALSGVFNGRVRMTLTPGVVNAGRTRVMEIVGADKASAFASWMLGVKLPVQRVRRVGTVVFADDAAAASVETVTRRSRSRTARDRDR